MSLREGEIDLKRMEILAILTNTTLDKQAID